MEAPARVATLRVGGRTLEPLWIGPPAGQAPTIVFLHEGLGSVSTWRDFPARLSEATGCGALVFSRAGHGRSDPPARPRTVRYLHEEALDVLPAALEAFSVARPFLFGHSDGATIALLYAGAYPDAPRGVIAEAPHVNVEEKALAGIRRTVQAYEAGALKEKLRRHHGDGTDALFRAWSGIWLSPEFRSWNVEDRLTAITCPVLVIQGEEDAYGTVAQVDSVVSRVAGSARALVLPACGHAPHAEKPDDVLAAAAAFVREATRGRAPGTSEATA